MRWYVAYPPSLRHVHEMMQERGVFVDHFTEHRPAMTMLPVLAAVFFGDASDPWAQAGGWTRPTSVAGQWKYLYRAVDCAGDTVDFLLTAKRDKAATRRFFERVITLRGVPQKITIDNSGANTSAIGSAKAGACVDIFMRQYKYFDNVVEHDYREVKRVTQPIVGLKLSWIARVLIGGIEAMDVLYRGQMQRPAGSTVPSADQFFSLAV